MEKKFQWNNKTQLYGLFSKSGAQTNWGPKVLKGTKKIWIHLLDIYKSLDVIVYSILNM